MRSIGAGAVFVVVTSAVFAQLRSEAAYEGQRQVRCGTTGEVDAPAGSAL